MQARYAIADSSDVVSPALVLYKDAIAANLRAMIAIAGGPERLRPHVKTHKMREIVGLEMAAGITRHKCATIAGVVPSRPLFGPAPVASDCPIRSLPSTSHLIQAR